MAKKISCLIIALLVLLPTLTLAAVDPATPVQIAELLAKGNPLKSNTISPEFIGNAAEVSTMKLGNGNPSWNKNHPKWDEIYEKVYTDTASDIKPFNDYMENKAPSDIESTMASHVTSQDANTILTYLATEQGQDYLEFNQTINKLMAGGISSAQSLSEKQPAAALTSEQKSNYGHMLVQSRIFQMMTIFKSSDASQSDDAVGMAMAGTLMNKFPEQLDALYKKYGPELSAFSTFNQSTAERNFLNAIALVTQQVGKAIMQIQYANTPTTKQHQAAWMALYKQEVVDN